MEQPTCVICGASHYARGWCKSHYGRWHRYGDPTHVPKRRSDEERFWAKVRKTDTCWLWQGSLWHGYGVFSWSEESSVRSMGAHRYAYQLEHGAIPEKLVIDHLCRVPACVNPEHLEPVTHRENVLRGVGNSAVNRTKTHCQNGHEFTPENTYVGANGHRNCRACGRERANRRAQERGIRPVSERAKRAATEMLAQHPDLTTAGLAAKLGWSHGFTTRVKRDLFGPVVRKRKPCSVAGCERLTVAKGFCNKHYERWKKHGDPLFERPATPTHCSVDGCDAAHKALGFCKSHYEQRKYQERKRG